MKRFSRQIIKLCLAGLMIVGLAGEAAYSQATTYVPDNSSRLWIEGSSNVNEFECRANQYFAEATLFNPEDTPDFLSEESNNVFMQVEIRVDGFECGRSRMNRDLRDALKSDQFPEIIFMFNSAEIIEAPSDNDDPFELLVNGSLTVAGNTKNISFTTRAYYINSSKVRAVGHTTIRMTDFDVTPPTALMGLVQARDELTVKFDLIASETDAICQLCPGSIH